MKSRSVLERSQRARALQDEIRETVCRLDAHRLLEQRVELGAALRGNAAASARAPASARRRGRSSSTARAEVAARALGRIAGPPGAPSRS
jgi:hypothetical protein